MQAQIPQHKRIARLPQRRVDTTRTPETAPRTTTQRPFRTSNAARIVPTTRTLSPATASVRTSPAPSSRARQALRLGFLLTVGILLVEVIGGTFAHSLALLSDAGHALTDVVALGLAWFAAAQAERPANARRTYGYHRVGILTALANGVSLVAIAGVIAFEAYQRLLSPHPVTPWIMVVSAAIAIGVNLFLARTLHGAGVAHDHSGHAHTHEDDGHDHAAHEAGHGAKRQGNLNARAAMLHIIGDVGASLAVVVGAIVIALTGAAWVDPTISVLIAIVIAFGALGVIRETLNILLEATPKGVETTQLADDMLRVSGVREAHDLHVWTITSGVLALSCHVVIDDVPPSVSAPILDRLVEMLRRQYNISHTTIQFESAAHPGHEGFCACQPATCGHGKLFCELSPAEDDHAGGRRAPSDTHPHMAHA